MNATTYTIEVSYVSCVSTGATAILFADVTDEGPAEGADASEWYSSLFTRALSFYGAPRGANAVIVGERWASPLHPRGVACAERRNYV